MIYTHALSRRFVGLPALGAAHKEKKSMGMLNSLSGYPEWLPEDRIVEQKLVKTIQEKFELFGFAPIETRSVEPLEVILSKGETDKEIYCLRRLQAGDEEADKNIGLHFDLTVPFSRYLLENRSKLTFPFRRYQIQKAWRGERPGLGRYREFLQADIDLVDTRPLSVQSDIEIIHVIHEILLALPFPEVCLFVNNRKLLEGFYRALGIEQITNVLRIVDKIDKIGEQKALLSLTENLKIDESVARKCIGFGKINGSEPKLIQEAVNGFGLSHPLIDEGLEELCTVLNSFVAEHNTGVIADLSIARGFDYYTGTVCEGKFSQFPKYPTIVAGGRYDSLVSDSSVKLPGVGMSLGITRILGLVLHGGLIHASRKTPSCVVVALVSEETRQNSINIARALRQRGIPCEVYSRPDKYGKQISYAEGKGIPFIWFPNESGALGGDVRDLRKREQVSADPTTWMPDKEDLEIKSVKDEDALQRVLKNPKYCK
jgi:histidyl-tRNA synthetase